MTQITQEQREALQAAGWTEEEAVTFAQSLGTFREGLPPRQRDAFNAILATAGAADSGEEVQGYIFQPSTPSGLSASGRSLPPAPGSTGQPPPTQSNLVVTAIIGWIMPLLLPAVQ